MIQIIPSEKRYKADHGWLVTYHSFSFAEYYDPNNIQFGALRVFNDDTVQPGRGFGEHPHADMEIMTYVIDGTLEHRDSLGNRGLLRAGEVQRMTAGTGIFHSEYNASDEKPVHFLQIWFLPDQKGLTPSWEQKAFPPDQKRNRLLPVVSGRPIGEALHIHQDVTVYLSLLEAGRQIHHRQEAGRRMYLFVIDGAVVVDGEHAMKAGDSARITGLSELTVSTDEGAEIMLMDLA
ncbi:MAG: pirin family protein [Planifilum sp.]|jgi:redox-sensitive bicupin YhaK (pirin superfamily)